MPREKRQNKRYGLYISKELNEKLNDYIGKYMDEYKEPEYRINAQDVLKQALTEFLEKHK
jgi:predicted esterase YcpF (UPF0227 family)